MKRNLIISALALFGIGVVYAAQDTSLTIGEVRNPVLLKSWLETNAADAEARLAAGGSVSDALALVNANNAGTAKVTLQADKADDAGDYFGIVATDGSGLALQSDADSKGVLATKLTLGGTGILTMIGGATIDNTTSSSILNLTETTVAITGNGTVSGTATIAGALAANAGITVDSTAFTVADTSGDTAIAGTLAVTGVGTFTAESVHNGGIDANYITTDAGAGIDAKSAGALKVGVSTATSVDIGKSGATTTVAGPLTAAEGIASTEDTTITLNASDEEIVIAQSSAAGTASTPLMFVNDDRTGATANETSEASIVIDAEGVYGIAITDGALSVEGATVLGGTLDVTGVATFSTTPVFAQDVTINTNATVGGTLAVTGATTLTGGCTDIDAATATTMLLGKSTATRVEIADTAVITEVEGPLVATEDIQSNELDSETATALLIGKATATAVTIGASDIGTTVNGTLTATIPVMTSVLDGTTTRILTSADYGKLIIVTNGAAVAITLPANGAAAGSNIEILIAGADANACAPTISAATADTLIGPNDLDLKSVTWGAGHRIGAHAKFISDGFFWRVQNLGGTTMTYND